MKKIVTFSVLALMLSAFAGISAMAQAPEGEIVHDAEYYVL